MSYENFKGLQISVKRCGTCDHNMRSNSGHVEYDGALFHCMCVKHKGYEMNPDAICDEYAHRGLCQDYRSERAIRLSKTLKEG